MKLNKLWASALALLALASCSKDLEPSANLVEPAQPAAEYQLVRMDIKATQDDNALRVGFGVSSGDDGALTGLALVDKNVNIRIAVKQGLNGTPVVDTYPFTKIGRASFAFSDKIKIPVKSGDEPYYMAAVLLSEGPKDSPDLEYGELNETKYLMKVLFSATKNETPLRPDSENKIYPNIPYRSQWQQVEMNAVGTEGKVVNHTTIRLKPLGTLLRFRIHNTSQSEQRVSKINFKDPTFSNKGDIDFSYTDQDAYPRWSPWLSTTMRYQLPEAITLQPDAKSHWYYIWLKSYHYDNTVRPGRVTVQYQAPGSGQWSAYSLFSTKKLLPEGSVSVVFRLRDQTEGIDTEVGDLDEAQGPWDQVEEIYDWEGTVLRRLSPGVVNNADAAPYAFIDGRNNLDVRNSSVGYFTFAEAQRRFKQPLLVEGKKYSLPTVNEMKSIFPVTPHPYSGNLVVFNKSGQRVTDIVEPRITISGRTDDYTADYFWITKRTYALRFKSTSNRYLTAFKYTLEGSNITNQFIRVKARLLGNDQKFKNLVVNDLANSSFWNDPTGIYDERVFPFYGSKTMREDPNQTRGDYNSAIGIWTSTPRTLDHGWLAFGAASTIATDYVYSSDIEKYPTDYPVFLFERK